MCKLQSVVCNLISFTVWRITGKIIRTTTAYTYAHLMGEILQF